MAVDWAEAAYTQAQKNIHTQQLWLFSHCGPFNQPKPWFYMYAFIKTQI